MTSIQRRVQSINSNGQIEFNTEIIDVNDACTLHILQLLNLDDLINFALADERFMKRARNVYQCLYAKGIFEIICGNARIKATVLHNGNTFSYNGPICLLIKHFGDLFTGIRLERNFMYKNYDQLEQCIVTHCAKTLIRFELSELGKRNNLLKNSFPNCESLSITNATLDDDLLPFNECFPALKHLTLQHIVYCSAKLITVRFPFLEHLTLIDAAISKVGTILPLNRQIRSFDMASRSEVSPIPNLFHFINETLPQLEALSIAVASVSEVCSQPAVSFKNVKKLKINVDFGGTTPVPLKCDVLQELHIIGSHRLAHMMNLIKQHPKITVLRLSSYNIPNEIIKCVSALPDLTELNLDLIYFVYMGDELDPIYVIQLLSLFRSVNFVLRLFNWPNFAQIQSIGEDVMGSEWRSLIAQNKLKFFQDNTVR